ALGRIRRLLRQPAVVGPGGRQGLPEPGVDGLVRVGDGRPAGLGADLQARLAPLQGHLPRLARRVAQQVEVGRPAHFPAIATASINRDGLLNDPRNSRSDPTTIRAPRSRRLPATVISLTGQAIWPSSNQKPDTP